MKDIRYHLSVKSFRVIKLAGMGLFEIIEGICEANGVGGAGLQEADR